LANRRRLWCGGVLAHIDDSSSPSIRQLNAMTQTLLDKLGERR
jgi:hypothetical protein